MLQMKPGAPRRYYETPTTPTETLVPRPPATPPPSWKLRMTLECRARRSSSDLSLEVESEAEAEDFQVEEESKDDPKTDSEVAQDSGKCSPGGSDVDDSRPVPPWRRAVCIHWLQNRCKPGKRCRFLHPPKEAVPSLEYVDPAKAAAHKKPRMVPVTVKAVALRPHPSTVRKAPQFIRPMPKMGINNRRVIRIKRVLDSGLEEGDEGPSIPSYESYGLVGAGLDEDDGDGGAAVRGDSPPLVRRRFAR